MLYLDLEHFLALCTTLYHAQDALGNYVYINMEANHELRAAVITLPGYVPYSICCHEAYSLFDWSPLAVR